MKNLLLYIVCFFALLACNKEESIRLQKEETIIAGTVTEQQRGTVIEGATVYLLEYLYPGNDDKCGTCQKIIDSTLTDANGNFEFRFNAKQGTSWNYKTWCEKQNYITKIASRFNDIVKAKTNTANLKLIATGGLKIYLKRSAGSLNKMDGTVDGYSADCIIPNVDPKLRCDLYYVERLNLNAGEHYKFDFDYYQTDNNNNHIFDFENYYIDFNKTITDTIFF